MKIKTLNFFVGVYYFEVVKKGILESLIFHLCEKVGVFFGVLASYFIQFIKALILESFELGF